MNRYTYKAKTAEEDKWVFGYLYKANDKLKIEDNYFSYFIKDNTLCQCTGLQDIDGNYIFENDILQLPLFIEDNQKALCIYNEEHNVNDIIGFGLYTYDNYYQRYSNLVQSDEWDEFKIIGNKFDKENI